MREMEAEECRIDKNWAHSVGKKENVHMIGKKTW
jgi:hypothetical protein